MLFSMCFMLYVGTNSPIPRREWKKDAPDISVESLTEHDSAIKTHFESAEVQRIGSTGKDRFNEGFNRHGTTIDCKV